MTTVYEFLDKLNRFYPSNDNTDVFQERVNEYSKEILQQAQRQNVCYDFDKVFSYIIKNYRYRTFPILTDIVNALEHGIATKTATCEGEGEVIIVTLQNGLKYLFEISGIGEQRDKVFGRMYKRFGKITVDRYPAGTCLIGNEVFVPDTKEKSVA